MILINNSHLGAASFPTKVCPEDWRPKTRPKTLWPRWRRPRSSRCQWNWGQWGCHRCWGSPLSSSSSFWILAPPLHRHGSGSWWSVPCSFAPGCPETSLGWADGAARTFQKFVKSSWNNFICLSCLLYLNVGIERIIQLQRTFNNAVDLSLTRIFYSKTPNYTEFSFPECKLEHVSFTKNNLQAKFFLRKVIYLQKENL